MTDSSGAGGLDWGLTAQTLQRHLQGVTDHIRASLRDLMRQACGVVGSAESSLLVPAGDGAHLSFLVSVNPTIEEAGFLVPMAQSVAGYVFNTGQMIATSNPDHWREVDEKTGVQTVLYMAVPVMSADQMMGVMTFVNRPRDKAQSEKQAAEEMANHPFTPDEIETAQRFAALCTVLLHHHRRSETMRQLALTELEEAMETMGLKPAAQEASFIDAPRERAEPLPLAAIVGRIEAMSPREQALCAEIMEMLGRRLPELQGDGIGD